MAVYVLPLLRLCAGRERADVAVAGLTGRPGAAAFAGGEGQHKEERQRCGNHSVCSGAGCAMGGCCAVACAIVAAVAAAAAAAVETATA